MKISLKNPFPQLLLSTALGCALAACQDTQAEVGEVEGEEQVFDIAEDFSLVENPNGAYAYGWKPAVDGAFTLFDTTAEGGGDCQGIVTDWFDGAIGGPPVIAKNFTVDKSCNGIPAGAVNFHPGPNGELAVLRWTSPAAGTATIEGTFLAGDSGALSVFISKDDAVVFTVATTPDDAPFSLTETVEAGTTIDFAVGEGFEFGSTPVDAVITLAP